MPYRPVFRITPRLLALVETIAVLRERILTASVQVAWIPSLQSEARIRTARSSTAIEGNPLTITDVRALAEGRGLPGRTERHRREVLNYFAGLNFIERNSGKRTITEADILRLHRIIGGGVMHQGREGEYRTIRVRVGFHIPPSPAEVAGLMRDYLEWWNGPAAEIPAVLSSSILHSRFEDIHPFADGNGRTGRTIALWELYRRGFDSHHIFSVDEYFESDRAGYYLALDSVRQPKGDLTEWLEYAAEGIRFALDRVWKRIQDISATVGDRRITLQPKQETLLRLLEDRKELAPAEIWRVLSITRQGAAKLIKPLVEAGLIRRIGGKKTGRYVLGGPVNPRS